VDFQLCFSFSFFFEKEGSVEMIVWNLELSIPGLVKVLSKESVI
jgi:hypothetical protein